MNLQTDSQLDLNNGDKMPRFGLGVFRIKENKDAINSISWALDAGYRLIDTAAYYENEAFVGEAIRASSLDRSEISVTTKLWNTDQGYDNTLRAFDKSLAALDIDYIDLYLVHYPVIDLRLETWKAMEKIIESGACKSIGVSNYMPNHMNELLANCNIPPSVNQIELSPYNYRSRAEIIDICRANSIQVEAYCPLTRGTKLQDPPLAALGNKYGKTPAQILIRWALQANLIVIPKSSNKQRIEENAAVFDFELSKEDMESLYNLDENLVTSWDPNKTL